MESADAATERLCSPEFKVSAHYLVGIDGTLRQYVEEDKRAWHAGAGEWRGRGDINSRSIGVELDNAGDAPFSEPQMVALEELLRELLKRWNIAAEGVIAHSDFALGRKIDPGPKFDWRRLAVQGLSVWPQVDDCVGVDEIQFALSAAKFGYPQINPDPHDLEFCRLLRAFRLRFAPWRTGSLTDRDVSEVESLAIRYGVLD